MTYAAKDDLKLLPQGFSANNVGMHYVLGFSRGKELIEYIYMKVIRE